MEDHELFFYRGNVIDMQGSPVNNPPLTIASISYKWGLEKAFID